MKQNFRYESVTHTVSISKWHLLTYLSNTPQMSMRQEASFVTSTKHVSPEQLSGHHSANMISYPRLEFGQLRSYKFLKKEYLRQRMGNDSDSQQAVRESKRENKNLWRDLFHLPTPSSPSSPTQPFHCGETRCKPSRICQFCLRAAKSSALDLAGLIFRSMKNAREINLVDFFFCTFRGKNIGSVKPYIMLTKSPSEGTWIVANSVICVF